ncbi:MAG: hypothetical protein ABJB74_19270 [Gemmatimonas sp.]
MAKVSTMVELGVLGGGSESKEYSLTNAFLYGGRNGTFFIVDVEDPGDVGNFRSTVRQYDSSGKFLRQIGTVGDGPGEFRGGVWDVKQLADGRILISTARGLQEYSAAGSAVKLWPAKAPFPNRGAKILIDPNGFILTYGSRRVPPREAIPGFGGIPFLYRFDLNGRLIDSTIRPPEVSLIRPSAPGAFFVPFKSTCDVSWNPTGFFMTACTGEYRVDLLLVTQRGASRSGAQWTSDDRISSFSRVVPGVDVQAAERDDWVDNITVWNQTGNGRQNWKWVGEGIPKTKPPIRELFADERGNIFVRQSQFAKLDRNIEVARKPRVDGTKEYTAGERWYEVPVYDVYSPAGRYLRQIVFPARSGQPLRPDAGFLVRDDDVWLIVRDGDDVPRIKRYRIQ